MSSIAIALAVLACVLVAAVLGFVLPGQHLDGNAKDSLKAAIGIVGTLTAMVLGLLIGTAKNSYDAKSDGITQVTIDILLLDRVLDQYGPDAGAARNYLREAATRRLRALWSDAGLRVEIVDGSGTAAVDALERRPGELKPATDQQRALKAQAMTLAGHLTRTILVTTALAGSSIPTAFLVVLAGWLVIMFAGIGALTPSNAAARGGVCAAALAFSTALFLILELDTPYGGVIQLSQDPVRLVLERLGK